MQRKNLTAHALLLALLFPIFVFDGCLPDMPIDPEPEPEPEKTWEEIIDPDGDGIGINPAYVPIDWDNDEATIVSHDAEKGDFTLDFGKNELPQIEKGSILTLDVDTGIFLRKVVSVTESDGKVMLKTEQARLDEVFFDTEFELRVGHTQFVDTLSSDSEWEKEPRNQTRSSVYSSNPTHIFYPKEVLLQDEEGNWYRSSIQSMTRAADDIVDHDITFIDQDYQLDLLKIDEASVGVKGNINLGTGLLLHMNFSTDDEWTELLDKYDHNRLYLKFALLPHASVGATFDIKGSAAFIDKKGEPKTMFKFAKVMFRFLVGIVPVEAEVDFKMNMLSEIKGSLNGTISAGAGFNWNAEVGFEVSQADGFKPYANSSYTAHLDPPTFSTSVNFNHKISFLPTVDMKLYKIIGPNVGFGPYIDANFGAGFVTDIIDAWSDNKKDAFGLGWQVDAGWGIEGNLGINATVFSKNIFSENKSITITKRKTFFEAPSRLSVASNTEYLDTKKWNEVKFKLESILLTRTIPTLIPVCVRFETDGEGWVSTDKTEGKRAVSIFSGSMGDVSIYWYPLSYSEELTAKVYAPDGKVLDVYDVKLSKAPSDVTAIDMGGSVLWASHNLGASQAEEYGEYYGWGDGSGTHKEQNFLKDYGSYVEDPKTCYDYYGGYDRNRNITGGSKDIVHKKWGGLWSMPTLDDWLELKEDCDWSWSVNGGVYVKSRKTGNTLFLPAAGSRWGEKKEGVGQTGEYWTSTYRKNNNDDPTYDETDRLAYYVTFGSGQTDKQKSNLSYFYTYRYVGQSIRPVRERED